MYIVCTIEGDTAKEARLSQSSEQVKTLASSNCRSVIDGFSSTSDTGTGNTTSTGRASVKSDAALFVKAHILNDVDITEMRIPVFQLENNRETIHYF